LHRTLRISSLLRNSSLLICALLAACAHSAGDTRAGRIWDARAERYVAAEQVFERAAKSRHVLLGETHDNAEHHRLQLRVLEALAARGEKRVLAMEQFDSEHQAAIDAARAVGADAERLADGGQFERKGWNWPLYKPLVEFALAHGWPLAGANLSRSDARAVVADPARARLPAPAPAVLAALERDIVEGHCGAAPPAARLAGMVEAQRARDARMAEVLAAQRTATVLIAGIGHVRKDRGVPLYLPSGDPVSVAFVEVQDDKRAPRDYFDGFATPASFDYLWFTPRAEREDPCKGM
jgi:uncharacterized iron-regulated protein